MPIHRSLLSLLSLSALAVGCVEAPQKPSPEVLTTLRQRYVLDTEPADAQTTLDWRDAQAEDEPHDASAAAETTEVSAEAAEPSNEIVLVGRVGGMPNPWGVENEPEFPWRAGQATFFLVDPSTAAEFASHAGEEGDDHAEDCPFCSREAANKTNAVAVVSFPAEAGDATPAAVDTRDLFGLKEGDLVVVRGQWNLAGDLLMVQADGLYRRP